MHLSAAMTNATEASLIGHLLRQDGQEDLCFATWQPSSGSRRMTALLGEAILPKQGERVVHGNASFQPNYVLRAAQEAAVAGKGLAFMHSHPGGRGYQILNDTDKAAEARIANIARELTGLPLVGLTLAGDRSWSARVWDGVGRAVHPRFCQSVRAVGDTFSVTFNDWLVPPPEVSETQIRTVHTWGDELQAKIARLRIAVAGVGSVGMPIAEILARMGVQCVEVFDFDTVELINIDRLHGAGRLDAFLKRPKIHVAERLLKQASSAINPQHELHELSVCEPAGLERLLDSDIIFSCVDKPWPRHVLNTIAYADLIPVVEGGLRAFQNSDGSFRNAYWRSTVVRPGRPCLRCLGQYDPALVQVERDGSLDDPTYIAALPVDSDVRSRENVAALSVSVTAALMQQFLSYVTHPSGIGDPGPLRYNARDHEVKRNAVTACRQGCSYNESIACGDDRLDPSAQHTAAENARLARRKVSFKVRVIRIVDDVLGNLMDRLVIRRT